jgi:hypothetical protein
MRKKKQESSKFETANTVKKIAVIIDSRTTIYVKEGTDPKEAKERFLEKYNLYNKIGNK